MRLCVTISALLLCYATRGQVFIEGTEIPSSTTYITATFNVKGMSMVHTVYVDAGTKAGPVTDASGTVKEFTGTAHILNWMDEQGWEYHGNASVATNTGKGATATRLEPGPALGLFRRK